MRLFVIIVLLVQLTVAQNKQLLYGFNDIPQSLLLNPGAEVKNDWYFGIPLISHIHANAGTSEATVYDIFANNDINFNTKLQNAVYSMKSNDFVTINEQVDIFSGGFAFGNSFEKNEYISFGFYQETDIITYFPKDYAILVLEGNADNINRRYNAGHLKVSGEALSVFHVGYNKKVNKAFTFGVRGKLYSSVVNINSVKNSGYFVTTPGDNNRYKHIFDLNMSLRTSGLASLLEDDNSDLPNDIDTFKKRLFFGGNLGLGLDAGFTYRLTDQWTIDGSVADIGFIRHSKDVENYGVNGRFEYEGINPFFPSLDENETADDYWSNIEDEFSELFTVDTTNTKYTTWRPVKLNASVNYAFGKNRGRDCDCLTEDLEYQNAVGLQLYSIFRPKQPQVALTAYYYRRLFKGLQVKGTYTVDSYSFYNLGLGLSSQFAGVQFYLLADNLLQYKNLYDAQNVSLQIGFNYIFNKNEN
ncbi:DUF5723 family protein [Aestuariibaculum sediminum]|uniref:DUF5723 domain-containing protein n=1 Tax=Aestuariibaculum sediminum TaxID=2770637 RepID=A0A8J6PY58_9FLAO|nr:DUF5723 family protein [Aestuariibaculum sediminum]MBD0830708.1 hypothetical protein [Aestuariibaculum sediminum]